MIEEKSAIEIISDEAGKTWTVTKEFTVTDERGKKLTIPVGYVHDRYTVAPNLGDERPAVAHDYAYDINGSGRKWDDGTPITRSQADRLFYHLMVFSTDKQTRKYAKLYYNGVRYNPISWTFWGIGSVKMWYRKHFG